MILAAAGTVMQHLLWPSLLTLYACMPDPDDPFEVAVR